MLNECDDYIVFSKDSDLVGGYVLPTVVRPVRDQKFRVYQKSTTLKDLGLSQTQLQTMFAVLNNDYGINIPGFGPSKLCSFVKTLPSNASILANCRNIFTSDRIKKACGEKLSFIIEGVNSNFNQGNLVTKEEMDFHENKEIQTLRECLKKDRPWDVWGEVYG